MGELEAEIVSRFRQLDHETQLRVLDDLNAVAGVGVGADEFIDDEEWDRRAEVLREQFRAEYGNRTINIQELLDEVREEGSWKGLSF
jgi:hypothetical protein